MSVPRQLLMRRVDLEDLPHLPTLPLGFTVRQIVDGEDELLAGVLSKSFGEMEWSVESVRKSLTRAPDVDAVFVVDHLGKPVATASARIAVDGYPDSGYLHWVGADPAYRGMGFGRTVSLRVMHHFKEIGCKDTVLETDDFRLPAIKIYLNLGYVPEMNDDTHEDRWYRIKRELGLLNKLNM